MTHPHSAADATHAAHTAAAEAALARLGLDAKARLLSGQDMWSLPAIPEIGLKSLVMSDGPIGVRGTGWSAADPSVALPSPTALAATWDPELARRAGNLLAQEARRKGVHVLLAPTVNLHRSPLGGRHFECYSEDPYLTGEIGAGYVRGVQQGGVGTTVKHFVGNDAETERYTVDNIIAPRPLRELYLAPFEHIVKNAHPWGIMTAYNQVNGATMTEHRHLVGEVLRGEWGFDGCNVSDWTAARDTVRALLGGLDVAMPGPHTVYGAPLAEAVRDGRIPEPELDAAVRRVLLLAARVGALEGVPAAVDPAEMPDGIDGAALAREVARRAFVLLRNEPAEPGPSSAPVLPLDPARLRKVAVIGAAAKEARVLGGGSATVFPDHIVSSLEGLRAALPDDVEVRYAMGADPSTRVPAARDGFALSAHYLGRDGELLAEVPQFDGRMQVWGNFPEGVDPAVLESVELVGHFTPRATGTHTLSLVGSGELKLVVDGAVLFDDRCTPSTDDPFEAFMNPPETLVEAAFTEDATVPVSLRYTPPSLGPTDGLNALVFTLGHLEPQRGAEEEIEEAVRAARDADAAVVVIATTEEVESEGFDRGDLRLPGRQDELVSRVAAANPRTVVVVNSGSPVELPWREEVPAVLLSWFPGQEAGAALADVLLGAHEPGGRLPTTWPARLADAPVTEVTPRDGRLDYREGLFIGYRAWERAAAAPAFPFGHGLGYTDWEYESLTATAETARVRLRNTGDRAGAETVQLYVTPVDADATERPARWLAGFARVEAAPGETAEAEIALRPYAFEIWDEAAGARRLVPGGYDIEAAHSVADRRLRARITVED
ncbi:beta-glucosidase [Streptomyces sp. 8N114]|uniref:beta-glucosidase family protein n=1 Tax=Streptomyces sp. 8N114 TaxID=3457419 RepID=UPI003FCFF79B